MTDQSATTQVEESPSSWLSVLPPATPDVHRASGLSSTFRIMASGRCTAIIAVGDFTLTCPCPCGVFDAPLGTLDVKCRKCTHPLSQHEDASSVPAQDNLPQGMASFVSLLRSS